NTGPHHKGTKYTPNWRTNLMCQQVPWRNNGSSNSRCNQKNRWNQVDWRLLKFKLKRINALIVSDCIGIFITARRRKLRIGSLISFAFASIKPRLHAQRLSTSMLYKRITRLHGET